MRYLLDSNVLLRLLQRHDPHHGTIRQAVRTLLARGDGLCCAPQNIVELRNVSTRPATARGGFGLTTAETDRRVRLIERVFTVLRRRRRSTRSGAAWWWTTRSWAFRSHDARFVAVMRVRGVTHVLTLNASDFSRYAGIVGVSPDEIVAAS